MQKILVLPEKRLDDIRHASQHNFPVQLTSLIGREQDIAEVCVLLRNSKVRLLTLTGTGGVGKTRLGLQVAAESLHYFDDGVCFVPLAPISNPNVVLLTIIQALGLEVPQDRSPLEYLIKYLHDKQKLLLLDNFEQVALAAPLLVELLQACPQLKVMVTCRTALHVRGEYTFLVPPLPVPDYTQHSHLANYEDISQNAAVALFIERVPISNAKPIFTQADIQVIAEICTRLDGLPLAIELAAAKIKLLSPQKLLARLDQCLQLLVAGACDLPERQQTLRHSLQWSYDLLSPEEQKLFRYLSIFNGTFTLEAAEAICHGMSHLAIDVLEGVMSLLDKSLLTQVEQRDNEPRLAMLGTTREFAMELLKNSGEEKTAQLAYITYYLTLAKEWRKNDSQQGVEANEPPNPSSLADLTTREIEVLRLVATGLTNHRIAEQFTLSHFTVKAHLRSIYSKLGISSRSAATRYAIEHKLLPH